MTIATLSPKFQIVIPKEIRKSMNLKPGQRLEFTATNGKIEIHPILTPDQLIGYLKGDSPLELVREPDREF